jgi:hypothetical protein
VGTKICWCWIFKKIAGIFENLSHITYENVNLPYIHFSRYFQSKCLLQYQLFFLTSLVSDNLIMRSYIKSRPTYSLFVITACVIIVERSRRPRRPWKPLRPLKRQKKVANNFNQCQLSLCLLSLLLLYNLS